MPSGNISKPITGETRYTLSYLALDGSTLTKTATVCIIPTKNSNRSQANAAAL